MPPKKRARDSGSDAEPKETTTQKAKPKNVKQKKGPAQKGTKTTMPPLRRSTRGVPLEAPVVAANPSQKPGALQSQKIVIHLPRSSAAAQGGPLPPPNPVQLLASESAHVSVSPPLPPPPALALQPSLLTASSGPLRTTPSPPPAFTPASLATQPPPLPLTCDDNAAVTYQLHTVSSKDLQDGDPENAPKFPGPPAHNLPTVLSALPGTSGMACDPVQNSRPDISTSPLTTFATEFDDDDMDDRWDLDSLDLSMTVKRAANSSYNALTNSSWAMNLQTKSPPKKYAKKWRHKLSTLLQACGINAKQSRKTMNPPLPGDPANDIPPDTAAARTVRCSLAYKKRKEECTDEEWAAFEATLREWWDENHRERVRGFVEKPDGRMKLMLRKQQELNESGHSSLLLPGDAVAGAASLCWGPAIVGNFWESKNIATKAFLHALQVHCAVNATKPEDVDNIIGRLGPYDGLKYTADRQLWAEVPRKLVEMKMRLINWPVKVAFPGGSLSYGKIPFAALRIFVKNLFDDSFNKTPDAQKTMYVPWMELEQSFHASQIEYDNIALIMDASGWCHDRDTFRDPEDLLRTMTWASGLSGPKSRPSGASGPPTRGPAILGLDARLAGLLPRTPPHTPLDSFMYIYQLPPLESSRQPLLSFPSPSVDSGSQTFTSARPDLLVCPLRLSDLSGPARTCTTLTDGDADGKAKGKAKGKRKGKGKGRSTGTAMDDIKLKGAESKGKRKAAKRKEVRWDDGGDGDGDVDDDDDGLGAEAEVRKEGHLYLT
ncbi:hypothetical protein BOTBODRAFT_180748 [Botryobasidium botryosum FD-172 SS1]|uniref:Uncharacterized protein n=1 Tax=Botryobasidium botryosum (strain FD-172 SS1) TaxID=930990 RepID=A0A067M752_BOTB1|nr:hypothetical protein BOTBODRAFT_180748 [Botryobasidium botryosum FD-172 SS1]